MHIKSIEYYNKDTKNLLVIFNGLMIFKTVAGMKMQ